MDAADVSPSDGVMIALLPNSAEWSTLELPHLTLVYAGSKQKLKPTDFNSLCKDAAALAALSYPVNLMVLGVELFGPDEDKVKVLRFRATLELMAMRRFVEHWNKSEYSFKPHSTIGPSDLFVEQIIPRMVYFDKIMVGWGDDQITFALK